MSIATKLGYGNIVQRLMLAGARKITDPHVPSNVTQEDCATVKNNIENTGTDTPHRTSKFQDLHLSPVKSSGSSSTCQSTASTDGVSMHSDGILLDSAAEKLPSDRFHDLHVPSAPATKPSSPDTISSSSTMDGIVAKETPYLSHDSAIVRLPSDRFSDLHPPTDTSTVRKKIPVPNSPIDDNAVPHSCGTSAIESSEVTAEIQSAEEEEWFIVSFDASAYPTPASVSIGSVVDSTPVVAVATATVIDSPLPSTPIEAPLAVNNNQEIASSPLVAEQHKQMSVRIRKIEARQRRRKEQLSMRRAKLKGKSGKEITTRRQKKRADLDDGKNDRQRAAARKDFHHKQNYVFEENISTTPETTDSIALNEPLNVKQCPQLFPKPELIIPKDELKQLTARVDKLAAKLDAVHNIFMLHLRDEHDHIEWDQEIEFVKNLERQVCRTQPFGDPSLLYLYPQRFIKIKLTL